MTRPPIRRTVPPLYRISPALLLATLGACGPADSAAPGASGPEPWTAEQDLRIGSVTDPDYALTWIRDIEVNDAGDIYSLHSQEQLVRRFDSTGALVGTIGGPGEGPGEFQNMATMGWVGDTLWILDFDGYRFSRFTPEGELLGDFTVPFEMGDGMTDNPPRANGLLSDGTVHGAPPSWSHAVATGEITHHRPMLMSREGEVTDTLPPIPWGNSTWAVFDPDDPRQGGSYGRQPYADGPLWAFVPGERAMLHLDREAPQVEGGATFTLTKLSFEGDTLFTREFAFEPVPLPEAEADSVLDARAAMLGERGFMGLTVARAREWAGRTLYRPPFRPPVEEMTVGRDGRIWLERSGAAEDGGAAWLVLDPSGEPVGEVTLPDGFNLGEAGREHVWGWEQDDLDVPYIVRYRIYRDTP